MRKGMVTSHPCPTICSNLSLIIPAVRGHDGWLPDSSHEITQRLLPSAFGILILLASGACLPTS